jgi:hypothetical protein
VWNRMQPQDLYNVWFELKDTELNMVNTNFIIEVEIKHL